MMASPHTAATNTNSAGGTAGSVVPPSSPSIGRRSKRSSTSSQQAAKGDAHHHHNDAQAHRHHPRRSRSPTTAAETEASTPPSRIVYGPGTIARLPTELGRLRLTAPLIVASPSRISMARRIQALIPNLDSHILDSAVVNVKASVVDDAVERVTDRDCVISVGGTSAVGLARAVSIRKGIPHICIPTTYSGSEVLHLLDCDVPMGQPDGSGAGSSVAAASRRPSSSTGGGQRRSSMGSPSEHRSRTTGSKNSSSRHSGVSIASRDARRRVKPAVVIYDEELTSLVPRRIVIPTNSLDSSHAQSAEQPQSSSPKWSFMQLPGL